MDPSTASLLAWLPRQRWFAATGRAPRLRPLAELPLPSPDRAARVRILVVVDDAPATPTVYQVPLVERAAGTAIDAPGLIGVDGGVAVFDGPHDPAFTAALLAVVAPDEPAAAGEVLRGEQSNTSIIYRPASGRPIICKVFRQLSAGLNPDIELQTALAGASSPHVPAVVGVFDGLWQDPIDPERPTGGTLAFAQEFFPGVEDAWRVALRAARAGDDFSAAAGSLGRATADVHLDLARLFPTRPADPGARAAIVGSWRRRLATALVEVPALAPHRDAIAARYAEAAAVDWPALQRIHGDYHLGQVLQVPDRGWVLLDFEGEPMRPMDERREPDLALRDIAGMLRSFDYVAGSLALTGPTPADGARGASDAAAWSATARRAFLAGYRVASGIEPDGPLLAALELDKAVYEASYEARHRPGWLSIPLTAVDRLVAG